MQIDFTAAIFFICAAYVAKALIEVLMRRQWLKSAASANALDGLLESDNQRRRASALFWGLILLSLALGFWIISGLHWQEVTPAVAAVLLGVTGLANLIFYLVYRGKR